MLAALIVADGATSAEAVGVPTVIFVALAEGVPSEEDFGEGALTYNMGIVADGVAPVGGAFSEAYNPDAFAVDAVMGIPAVVGENVAVADGIAETGAVGQPNVEGQSAAFDQVVAATGIANGIPPTDEVGQPAIRLESYDLIAVGVPPAVGGFTEGFSPVAFGGSTIGVAMVTTSFIPPEVAEPRRAGAGVRDRAKRAISRMIGNKADDRSKRARQRG